LRGLRFGFARLTGNGVHARFGGLYVCQLGLMDALGFLACALEGRLRGGQLRQALPFRLFARAEHLSGQRLLGLCLDSAQRVGDGLFGFRANASQFSGPCVTRLGFSRFASVRDGGVPERVRLRMQACEFQLTLLSGLESKSLEFGRERLLGLELDEGDLGRVDFRIDARLRHRQPRQSIRRDEVAQIHTQLIVAVDQDGVGLLEGDGHRAGVDVVLIKERRKFHGDGVGVRGCLELKALRGGGTRVEGCDVGGIDQ
jgi:hypothetical protein